MSSTSVCVCIYAVVPARRSTGESFPDSPMSKLPSLKAAESLADVARLLGFRPKAVSYVLYKQPTDARYRTFQIPKRNGGQRTIQAPAERLKLLQRRLADLLQDCVEEINATAKRKDRIAHGFKRGRSIITNAQRLKAC